MYRDPLARPITNKLEGARDRKRVAACAEDASLCVRAQIRVSGDVACHVTTKDASRVVRAPLLAAPMTGGVGIRLTSTERVD